jgi:hypothetical protein
LSVKKHPAFVKKDGKKIRAEIGAEPSKSIVSPAYYLRQPSLTQSLSPRSLGPTSGADVVVLALDADWRRPG